MAVFCGTYNIMFWSAWLSVDLSSIGFSDSATGDLQLVQSFVYLFACLILPYTFESSSRRLQFMISFLGFTAFSLMLGLSPWLDMPTSGTWATVIIVAAFPILGFC
jgi:MFS family permease